MCLFKFTTHFQRGYAICVVISRRSHFFINMFSVVKWIIAVSVLCSLNYNHIQCK